MRCHFAVILFLAGVAPLLAQETPVSRILHVVVNDPMNRQVTGLPSQDFDVIENGALRPITTFLDANSSISLAIVGQSIPDAVLALRRPDVEIVAAQSVAEAVRVLAASKKSRKALIFTTGTLVGEIPSEIQSLKAGPQNLLKSVTEVMNSYSLSFSSANPASVVEVSLRAPAGLPPLTVSTR